MLKKYIRLILEEYPKPEHRFESENEFYCKHEKALGEGVFGTGTYVCRDCTKREAALEIIKLLN